MGGAVAAGSSTGASGGSGVSTAGDGVILEPMQWAMEGTHSAMQAGETTQHARLPAALMPAHSQVLTAGGPGDEAWCSSL